jgi:hypothetical protein
MHLRQGGIVTYLIGKLQGMSDNAKKRTDVKALEESLTEIRALIDLEKNQPASKTVVEKVLKSSEKALVAWNNK